MVRIDESAAGIRDMNRRLQRMVEETISKNLVLQKVCILQSVKVLALAELITKKKNQAVCGGERGC